MYFYLELVTERYQQETVLTFRTFLFVKKRIKFQILQANDTTAFRNIRMQCNTISVEQLPFCIDDFISKVFLNNLSKWKQALSLPYYPYQIRFITSKHLFKVQSSAFLYCLPYGNNQNQIFQDQFTIYNNISLNGSLNLLVYGVPKLAVTILIYSGSREL